MRTQKLNQIRQQAVEACSQKYTLADYGGDVERYIKDAETFVEDLKLDDHDMGPI